jgi:hypothetical protein
MAINFDHHANAAKMGAEIKHFSYHAITDLGVDKPGWYFRWSGKCSRPASSWYGPFESIGDAYGEVHFNYCDSMESAANDHQREE